MFVCLFVCFITVFRFSEVNFRDINDIPISLIKGVALCLREKKCVCRMCFFGERSLSEEDVGAMCNGDDQHKWFKPIAVIPGTTGWTKGGSSGEDCSIELTFISFSSLLAL